LGVYATNFELNLPKSHFIYVYIHRRSLEGWKTDQGKWRRVITVIESPGGFQLEIHLLDKSGTPFKNNRSTILEFVAYIHET